MSTLHAPKIDALTGLRAVAALIVFLYHWGMYSGTGFFGWGFAGVSLFFALSGFVLTVNYENAFSKLTAAGYFRFMRARLARVWPIHMVGFLLSIPLLLLLSHAVIVKGAVLNIALLHSFIPRTTHSFNSDSWSLSNELFFYMLFPLFCCLLSKKAIRTRVLLIAFIALSATLLAGVPAIAFSAAHGIPSISEEHLNWLLYFCPLVRVSEFALGMLAAKYWRAAGQPEYRSSHLAYLVTASVFLWIGLSLANVQEENYTMLFGPPFAAMLPVLAGLRAADPVKRFLSGAWMVRLGEWSFSFYIVHEILLRAAVLLKLNPYWTGAMAFAVALPASALLYTRVETPMRKLLLRRRTQVSADTEPARALA